MYCFLENKGQNTTTIILFSHERPSTIIIYNILYTSSETIKSLMGIKGNFHMHEWFPLVFEIHAPETKTFMHKKHAPKDSCSLIEITRSGHKQNKN